MFPILWFDRRKVVFSAPNPVVAYQLGETRLVTIPSPGGPQLNARIILPTNFNPGKRYPVILNVYNGPHVQLVANTWLGAGELWMHHLAEEGFIIFSIDGRGSANRGFVFESAIFRHVGDDEMEDQLAGIAYMKTQTFVDPARIGVYGWSYGGFMTLRLLAAASERLAAGVSGAPVTDMALYDTHYTERFLSDPKH